MKLSFFQPSKRKKIKILAKSRKWIDRRIFFAYNIIMKLKSINKEAVLQWMLRIALTVSCMVVLGFIFSNSLKPGEQSAQQSSTVVEVVQEVAAVIAPNSAIANATGAAYDRLHTYVRIFAHFAEFTLFGALLLWCIVSYTWKKEGLWLSLVGVCLVPIIDESLQFFVAGRGTEFCDVCIDVAGGICGILFAIVVLLIIVWAIDKRRLKKAAAHTEKE